MQTTQILALLLVFLLPSFALAEEAGDALPPPVQQEEPLSPPQQEPTHRRAPQKSEGLWYRDAGEYIASRSTRMGVPTEVNSKIITDGKRFDVSLGKRIPLLTWGEKSASEAWVLGVDGGMLASLQRYSRQGKLTFATNTFDGYFGAFLAYSFDGWIAMLRSAHLSAHLVDNSAQFFNATSYSHFWNELIVGKTFPRPDQESNWDLHLQGSIGANNTSSPPTKQPRATLGASFGYALAGSDSLAILASADAIRAGVEGQKESYSFFLGLGSLNRPQSTHRPFRIGLAHYSGSDYRNQFYFKKQKWTTFEVSLEL